MLDTFSVSKNILMNVKRVKRSIYFSNFSLNWSIELILSKRLVYKIFHHFDYTSKEIVAIVYDKKHV